MSRQVNRRTLLAATAAGVATALGRVPAPAIAQAAPIKIGLLTVKVGPLAQGGIQMEQGVLTYLKESSPPILAALRQAPRPRPRNWSSAKRSI